MAASRQAKRLANGINAIIQGTSGTPVILLPGYPQTVDAYRGILPALSAHHQTIVLDPPGLGYSAPSTEGYDTGAISRLLEESIQSTLGERRYHLVGHDIGAWIAFPWAAQFPGSVKSLTVMDAAIPGLGAPRSFPLPPEDNVKLWQFSFNMLPEIPEMLTRGKERELFDWFFDNKAKHPERLSPEQREEYAECYRRPGVMSSSFNYYRALPESVRTNKALIEKGKLRMPVLALGGKDAMGLAVGKGMEPVAEQVEVAEVEDCGHYVMEEQPEVVAEKLLAFFKGVDKSKD